MIGLVVVSHSAPLAQAAVSLAAQMVAGELPTIEVAAGTADGGLGTDATAVAEAVTRADAAAGGAGVLVFVDLGSALLAAQMALEFCAPDLAGRTQITAAPLVEGLFVAVVTATTGAGLADVRQAAESALTAKAAQLS